jgi:hypothetical protein
LASGRIDKPPAYSTTGYSSVKDIESRLDEADDDSQDGGSLEGMGIMQWDNQPLRSSVEAQPEDEGVDMEDFPRPAAAAQPPVTKIMPVKWDFRGLDEQDNPEVLVEDIGSDVAQNDSSGDEARLDDSLDDDELEPILGEPAQGMGDYGQDEFPPYNEMPPELALDDQAHLGQITEGVWNNKVYRVPVGGDDQASDKVDEIVLADEEDKDKA